MSNGSGGKTRVTHITRIFQNNDKDSDTWVDVERIDELWVESGGSGADWQERHYTFDWEGFETQATTKQISNPDDPDIFIEVPIRDGVTIETKGAARYQKYIHVFLNGETNKSRRTHSRKIYHYDIDDNYLQDGEPPSDPQNYLEARASQDKGQYVEVEILDEYVTSSRSGRDIHGRPGPGHWQQRIWHFSGESEVLDNDPDALTGTINPDAGPMIDPPWRLDPLQNIINVNWGSLAVIFGPAAENAPTKEQYDELTKAEAA